MLRSPQHWVLQLSVAPTRRTFTTAASSSYASDKPPPPPSYRSSSSASSRSSYDHDHNHNYDHNHAAAAAATKPVSRVFSIASEPNVAPRTRRMPPPSRMPSGQRTSDSPEAEQVPRAERSGGGLASYFPLGWRDAAHQWWHSITPAMAERNVLSFVPYVREAKNDASDLAPNPNDPYGNRVWRSQMVPLSGKNRALNEYSIERVGEETTDTLVVLHGYGAGLGFFYRNFEPLSRLSGWQLYALDMLGMGNSSRPPFKVSAKDPKAQTLEAESWFVDSLEEWRRIRKIERMTLMGHSLGGYLAVSYAIKYPGRINKLILASPVGVPEDPYAVSDDLSQPHSSTMASEFTQDQDMIAHSPPTAAARAAAGEADAKSNKHSIKSDKHSTKSDKSDKDKAEGKPERRPLPGWFAYLWDANVSPFSLVRMSGPLGPRLVSGWTSRRFSHLDEPEADALHAYTYNLFRQRGSGEYALPYLLAPGAYARSPVIHRIHEVGRQVVQPARPATATAPAQPAVRETGYPIVMMYGDHDWMDVAGGFAAQEKIKARVEHALLHATPEEQARENGSAKVVIVRNAGHHLYLDNPDEFNRYIESELVDSQEHERRLRLKEP